MKEMNENGGYWTSETLEFIDIDEGDEIEFADRHWCVETWDYQYGHQRQGDTIMHCNAKLRNVDDPLNIVYFKLYPGWYLTELKPDQHPPEFKYTLVKKAAWEQIWVRKNA